MTTLAVTVITKNEAQHIGHCLESVKWADEIIVLDEGSIAERGSHEFLVQNGGLYQQLYYKQQLEKQVSEA